MGVSGTPVNHTSCRLFKNDCMFNGTTCVFLNCSSLNSTDCAIYPNICTVNPSN